MVKVAKTKRLSNRQKAENARFKKEMQEKGILPPDKPRLNRRKYVEEARQEWNDRDSDCFAWEIYLYQAVSIMLGAVDRQLRVTPEAVGVAKITSRSSPVIPLFANLGICLVGVAKCLKLAIRLKEFSDHLKVEGKTTYTLGEQLEYIKDILEA